VTDLGTEFGVNVQQNGNCELHVFQGVVEAVTMQDGKPTGQPRKLVEGQVASVSVVQIASLPHVEMIVGVRASGPEKFVRIIRPSARLARSSGRVLCKWETGPMGTFNVANSDLINVGQPTLSALELTSGTATAQGSVSRLNDGIIYNTSDMGPANAFMPRDGAVVTVILNTSLHPLGYEIKSVVTLTGSLDDRSSQRYDLAYSSVNAPDQFFTLRSDFTTTVCRYAEKQAGEQEARATLRDVEGGLIALGVAKLRFTFRGTMEKPESLYREIDVFGSPTAATD
jgi:hypothetical protein